MLKWLRWQEGRQQSGYDKLRLWSRERPWPSDGYLLRFRAGSRIGWHRDPSPRPGWNHHRVNVILRAPREGGQFEVRGSVAPYLNTARVKWFRPDATEHSVTEITQGERWVLSVGWLMPQLRAPAESGAARFR